MLGFLLPLIGSVSYAQTPSNLEPTPESSPESTPEESPPSPSPSLSSPPPLPPAPVPDGTVLNPLEPQPDPLLPEMVVDRPLNPQEKKCAAGGLE